MFTSSIKRPVAQRNVLKSVMHVVFPSNQLFLFFCFFTLALSSPSWFVKPPNSLSGWRFWEKMERELLKGEAARKEKLLPLFLHSPLLPLTSPFPYPPGKSCYSGQAIKANRTLTLSLGLVGGTGCCPSSPESFNVLPLELL